MPKKKSTPTNFYSEDIKAQGYNPPPVNTYSLRVEFLQPRRWPSAVVDFVTGWLSSLPAVTAVSPPTEVGTGSFVVACTSGEDLTTVWSQIEQYDQWSTLRFTLSASV